MVIGRMAGGVCRGGGGAGGVLRVCVKFLVLKNISLYNDQFLYR